MKRLLEAFYLGKRVAFTPWNEIDNPNYTLNKQTYNDLHARLVVTILRKLPNQADEKARMTLAQKITDAVLTEVNEELNR